MYDMHGLRSIACGLVKSEANALFRTEYYVMYHIQSCRGKAEQLTEATTERRGRLMQIVGMIPPPSLRVCTVHTIHVPPMYSAFFISNI